MVTLCPHGSTQGSLVSSHLLIDELVNLNNLLVSDSGYSKDRLQIHSDSDSDQVLTQEKLLNKHQFDITGP